MIAIIFLLMLKIFKSIAILIGARAYLISKLNNRRSNQPCAVESERIESLIVGVSTDGG